MARNVPLIVEYFVVQRPDGHRVRVLLCLVQHLAVPEYIVNLMPTHDKLYCTMNNIPGGDGVQHVAVPECIVDLG